MLTIGLSNDIWGFRELYRLDSYDQVDILLPGRKTEFEVDGRCVCWKARD